MITVDGVDGVLILSSSLQSKIVRLTDHRGQRVRVCGWVHRKRDQQEIMFVVVRDGTGYLQAVFAGQTVRAAKVSPTLS